MSKIVAEAVIRGAHDIVKEASLFLDKAIKENGVDEKIEFPSTAFYLPMANALLNAKAEKLKDLIPILEHAKSLLPQVPSEKLWLPYLGDALNAGMATLFSEEIIMALRYLYAEEPQKDCNGFFTDTIMRTLGIQLVDGRMAGFAAILGAAPDNKTAVEIVRALQQRNILTFVGSSANGRSIIDQLLEENVQMGWDNYIVPYGRDTVSAIYPLNWAIRSALTFGGIKAGQAQKCLMYTKERVFAFGLVLGPLDDRKYATGAGAINMGFPIIADTDIPEIKPSGITTYEALVKELDHKKIVPRCIEVRGVKVKVSTIEIPLPYSAAFEGERVRREQMHAEFGSKASLAFEFLYTKPLNEIEDGKIKLVGNDIDVLPAGQKSMPLAIIVEVAGRKMQKDFEPILERQIHRFVNYAMGLMHVGQRNMNWIRISKDSYEKGFRIKHIGTILHSMIHQEYSAIVDKVQVTLYTGKEDVERLLPLALKAYGERDERLGGMTDESVDIFYSCLLCQSFAPNHVCIITPERLGLCGAYSWLDGKASYEITPTGPNQPVSKGQVLDQEKGQWENINSFVYNKTNKSVQSVSMYSIIDFPQTSCGCFECIVAIIPEVNGVMVVHRDYSGMTPSGMSFTTLAGSVGGGVQTPGFLGVGKLYLISRKFISAEGGLKRLVWMPKELKDVLSDKLKTRCAEIGEPDFLDKIADETIATDASQLIEYLKKVNHPALTMPSLV
ncbi:MAG: CO dehydrogenase/CO-methylating acetyl-CoA synthase complex subunit beta [Candidatus Omnitrophica bacterium]|nr:CO dehydrogenase/CO-methylating acetyl-CoA synthase complex subunit beta [Candidatus Omnitrophota bacterium]MBU1923592.1 CO dehydrogenase/CO-methylating acetyl-CoA synthase complex subunit beta [Candidatus Omnitrophota bacterium]